MVRVKTALTVFGLLFPLTACLQKPIASISIETPTTVTSPTPFATAAETVVASPTPWVGGIETALAAFTPATPDQSVLPTFSFPTAQEKPRDFSPVLYGGKVYQTALFLLLGGVSRETWLSPDMSVARFSGALTYSLHSFTQEGEYFVPATAPAFSPTCKGYIVGAGTGLEESGFVGVADGWDVTKRPVTELADGEQVYQQAVIDWLEAEGIPAPEVDSIYVFRVDIEGDGIDEVFLSAKHLDDSQHYTKAGDYSIILMRQVVGNQALTKLVVGELYHSQDPEITYPRTYTLANFIDLNQDGDLEVVVETRKWEVSGARVFQIDGEDVIQTLGAECPLF